MNTTEVPGSEPGPAAAREGPAMPADRADLPGGRVWLRHLNLVALLAVAALPSILLLRDRWLDQDGVRNLLREAAWCRVELLCKLAWPSYFLLVFAAVAFVLAAFLFSRPPLAIARPRGELALELPPPGRRQQRLARVLFGGALFLILASALRALLLADQGRVLKVLRGSDADLPAALAALGPMPGADLAVGLLVLAAAALLALVPLDLVRRSCQRGGRLRLAQGLTLLALLVALGAHYAPPTMGTLLLWLLAAGAVVAVWPRLRRSGPVYWLTLLALALASLHLGAWWRSIIGDEFTFYYEAADIAFRRPLPEILGSLFDATWTYGTHPFASTLIQALGLRLLGINVFGWRVQDALLVAAALPLFYAFWNTFMSRRLALLAALFLAPAAYLLAFAGIGYNNLQAYFVLALALAKAALAIRLRRPAASLLAGLALGTCFYVFPGALYVLPVALWLFLLYDPPLNRGAIGRWLAIAAGLFLLIWPLVLQPDYLSSKLTGTLLINPSLAADSALALRHVARNLAYAAFSYLYLVDESHYVAAGQVDPLTAAFLLLGLGLALAAALRRDRFALFSLGAWLMLLVLAGASHDKTAPPNTRMFLLVPFYAWLAGLGLAWVADRLAAAWPVDRRPELRRRVLAGLPLAILLVLIGLNYAQAYPLSRQRLAGRYQPLEAVFLRAAGTYEAGRGLDDPPPTWLFLRPAGYVDSSGPQHLLELYQRPYGRVLAFDPADPASSAGIRGLLGQREVLALVETEVAEDFALDYGADLQSNNRASCTLRNEAGEVLAELWYPAPRPSPCGPAAAVTDAPLQRQ